MTKNKKTFTRKELLHCVIQSIRNSVELSNDYFALKDYDNSRVFYKNAHIKAALLSSMRVISFEKELLLDDIITRSCSLTLCKEIYL